MIAFFRAGFRVETCPMLESGSDRSPPPPKIGCSSRGYLEKELPPSSSKIRKHGPEACSSPGQQPQRRPPPPKILGVPLAGPARVWAWTCSSVGLGLARVRALLLQKYSGSPLRGLLECGLGPARLWAWGLLECGPSSSKTTRGPPCGACSSVCSAPPSSSKNTRASNQKRTQLKIKLSTVASLGT